MRREAILASVALVCSAAVAGAAPMIIAGDHVLLPNTAGQKIMIMTAGEPGDEFQGVDLHLAIGDGGPIVTGIDLIGPGTLLFGNNFGQVGYFDPAFEVPTRQPGMTASTMDGMIGPNGVLAFLTVDTTGIAPGVYSLSLTHPLLGESDLPLFTQTTTLRQDGTLTVVASVPEPGSIVLGLFAAAGLGAVAIRCRRARA